MRFLLIPLVLAAAALPPPLRAQGVDRDDDTIIDKDTSLREEMEEDSDDKPASSEKEFDASQWSGCVMGVCPSKAGDPVSDRNVKDAPPPKPDPVPVKPQKPPQTPGVPDKPQPPAGKPGSAPRGAPVADPRAAPVGGTVGTPPPKAPPPPARADRAADARRDAGRRAVLDAANLAGPDRDAGAMPGGGLPGAGAKGGRGPGAAQLLQASAAMFPAAYRDLGLKVEGGKLLRLDGTPATADDMKRLEERINSDPLALQRFPDLFKVIERARYLELREAAGKGALRDMGLSADGHDIVRTRSCAKGIDDECSPPGSGPYKAGDYVSPADLKAASDALLAGPAKTESYHEYFDEELKDKKVAKLVKDPAAFDRAIASCLKGSGSVFDGAALDKLPDGDREQLFRCGVVVLQQDAEAADLTAKKASQGRRFKGQARLDELLKFGADRLKRGLQTSAPEAPAPAVSGGIRRDLTVSMLASLVEMPGLPDGMRKSAGERLFVQMDFQFLEAQAGKAQALLAASAADDPALGALKTRYEDLQKGRETPGYADRLRDWVHDVDAALAKSRGGKLGQETDARTGYAAALLAAQRKGQALQADKTVSALLKANPDAAALLEKDPKDLTEKEAADLKALHEKLLAYPVYRDYLKARDAALGAGASLDAVQAAMPDLAAYRKAAAERSALLRDYQAAGFIPDKTTFTARELGLPDVPPDSKVVKDKEAGLDGLWVYPAGKPRVFSSFDGRLTADSIPGKDGETLRWRRYDGQGRALTETLKGKGPGGAFVEEDKLDPATGHVVRSTVKGAKGVTVTEFDPKTEKTLVVQQKDAKGTLLSETRYAADGGWTTRDAANGLFIKVGAAAKDGTRPMTQTHGNLDTVGKLTTDYMFVPEATRVAGTGHAVLFDDKQAPAAIYVDIDVKNGGVDWDALVKKGMLPQGDAAAFKQLAGSLVGMNEGELRAPDAKKRLEALQQTADGKLYSFDGEPKLVKQQDGHWALKFKTTNGYQAISYTYTYQDGRWVEIGDDGTSEGKGWAWVVSYTNQRKDGQFGTKEEFNHCMANVTYKGSVKEIEHGNCHRIYVYNEKTNAYDKTLDDYPKDKELSRWDMMSRGLGKTFQNDRVLSNLEHVTSWIGDRGIDVYYGVSSGAEEITRPSRLGYNNPGVEKRSIVYGVLTKYQMPMFNMLDKKKQAGLMMDKLHSKLSKADFDDMWREWTEDYRKAKLKAAETGMEAYSAKFDEPTEEEIGVWLIDGQGPGGLKGAGAVFARQAADSDSVAGKIGWGTVAAGTYAGEFTAMSLGFNGVGGLGKKLASAAEATNAGKAVKVLSGALEGYEKIQGAYFQVMLGGQALRMANAFSKDDKYELADSLAQAGGLLMMPGGDHKREKARGLEGTTFTGLAREVLTTSMGYKAVKGGGGVLTSLADRFAGDAAPARVPVEGGAVFPEPPAMDGWKPKQVRDWYATNWGVKGNRGPQPPPTNGGAVFPEPPAMDGWNAKQISDWYAKNWGTKGGGAAPAPVPVGGEAVFPEPPSFDGWKPRQISDWYAKNWGVKGNRGPQPPPGQGGAVFPEPPAMDGWNAKQIGDWYAKNWGVKGKGASPVPVQGGGVFPKIRDWFASKWGDKENVAPERPAPEPVQETPTDPDGATKAARPGSTPKAPKAPAPDPVAKPWSQDTVKPEQTVNGKVAYDRRVSALEKNAVIRDGALVENAASGPLDGHGSVLMREPYEPNSKAQRERIARLNALGFEVEFPREPAGSKKPALPDPTPQPWSQDTIKPEQTVNDKVPYDRRVAALEKNAVIRDDAQVKNVDSGPLHGRGTVLMREPYEPGSKAQQERIARLNKLGFEVEFPREPEPRPEPAPESDTTGQKTAVLKPDAAAEKTTVGSKPGAKAPDVAPKAEAKPGVGERAKAVASRAVAWAKDFFTKEKLPSSKHWEVIEAKPDPAGTGRLLTVKRKTPRGSEGAATEGRPEDFIAGHPKLAEALGISIDAEGNVTMPDIDAFNARLAKLRGVSVDKLPVKFVLSDTKGVIPDKVFLEHWAKGEMPIAADGQYYFHDFWVHAVGYGLMPEGALRYSQMDAGSLLGILNDPDVAKEAPRIKEMAERRIHSKVVAMDTHSNGVQTNLGPDGGALEFSLDILHSGESRSMIENYLNDGRNPRSEALKKYVLEEPPFDSATEAERLKQGAADPSLFAKGPGEVPRSAGSKARVPESTVKANAGLRQRSQRVAAAKEQMRVTDAQAEAIADAHDQVPCAVGRCSKAQLKSKVEIMRKAGLDMDQTRAAIERGLAGGEEAGDRTITHDDTRQYWNYEKNPGHADLKTAYDKAGLTSTPADVLEHSDDPAIRDQAPKIQRLQDAIAEAESKGHLAKESWEGQQACSEGNCVSRAVVNAAPQGERMLHEVVDAAAKRGFDANEGLQPDQLRVVLADINARLAAEGKPGQYVSVPSGEFFARQKADIAKGRVPQAGMVVIRTGETGSHAVVDRGPLVDEVDGESYRVLTDSNRPAAVAYESEPYTQALLSDYAIVFDPAAKPPKPATMLDGARAMIGSFFGGKKADAVAMETTRSGPDAKGPRTHEPDRGRAPPENPVPHEAPKADAADPIKGQKQRYADFEAEVLQDIKPVKMKAIPEGMPPALHRALGAVLKLFSDKRKPFEYMQQFEREVVARSKAKGESLETAREAVLRKWERAHGFGDVITLEDKIYDEADWQAMLRKGEMFKDQTFKHPTVKDAEGGGHGAQTHRLQWHIIMRAMVDDPAAFGQGMKAVDIFKGIGGLDYGALDWRGTGLEDAKKIHKDIWYQLLDSNDYNWTSPEFLHPNHGYWPGIGVWE